MDATFISLDEKEWMDELIMLREVPGQENYKTQTNRKLNFVDHTWHVTEGQYKGNWVAMWGEYDCTINGKDVRVPFQTTAHITNGKIDSSISYWDNLSPSLSLGFTLTPPKGN